MLRLTSAASYAYPREQLPSAERVIVPGAFKSQAADVSATSMVVMMAFAIVLAVVGLLMAKIRTERKSQESLQAALAAMQEVLKSANEQTAIAQQVNRTQEANAKMLLGEQSARIKGLTELLIDRHTAADARVREAVESAEARHHQSLIRAHDRMDALEQELRSKTLLLDRLTRIIERSGIATESQLAETLRPMPELTPR